MEVYRCRLCDRGFHFKLDVIGIFSEEGISKHVAAQILYLLKIMITENDPTSKYICKVCYGHIEVGVRFYLSCHETNYKIMNTLDTKPSNRKFKEAIKQILKIPIHSLYTQKSDIKNIYNLMVEQMKSSENNNLLSKNKTGHETGQSIARQLRRNANNSYSSEVNIENNAAIANGTPQNSSVSNAVFVNSVINGMIQITHIPVKNVTHHLNTVNTPNIPNSDEIICLDDDDDDIQLIENNDVHPLNTWIVNPSEKDKTRNNSVLDNKRQILQLSSHTKKNQLNETRLSSITSVNNNILIANTPSRSDSRSSNISTEEMTVTPDISIPMNIVSTLNRSGNNYYSGSQVTAETGIHFLSPFYTPELCVNNTNDSTNENQIKKQKPLKTKRKGLKNDHKSVPPTKKLCQQIPVERKNKLETVQQPHNLQSVIIEESSKSISKLRPKRASATSNTVTLNSGLWKLGDKADKELRVNIVDLNLSVIQCPICNKIYSTPNIRQKHERRHFLPGPSTDLSVDSNLSQDSKEQQEFLICLNLVRKQNKNSIIDKLAKRSHLLKSLNTFGNNLTSYNCHLCEYKTSKRFILWAHMSTFHMNLNTDEKTCSFCFLCERGLNRRVKLLKHLDKCKENKLEDNISSSSTLDNFICYLCKADDLQTLSELENHLWSHVNE